MLSALDLVLGKVHLKSSNPISNHPIKEEGMSDPVSLVVSPIVNRVIDEVVSFIKEKFHLLQHVEKEIENLESVLTAIRAVLQDAENRQLDEPPLRDWLGKLEEAAYDAEDVLEIFATEACLWQRKQKDNSTSHISDQSRHVSLLCKDAEQAALEVIDKSKKLRTLLLPSEGTGFPLWIRDGLLQNLATISLKHCTKCKVLSLGQLPHLGELYIKGMQELEEWPDVQYPSLTRLKIRSCPKLKKLPKIFLNLRVLKVKKCDSLRELPLSPSLMFLILVDNLVLENWNEAILRLAFVNEQGQLVSQQNRPSYISLIELKIINCPKLQALPEHFAPQKLEIRGCELLSALPIPEHFQRLQHLSIDACHDGTLVRVIPDTGSLYSLVISNISNLASLPKWPHLPGLKALYIRDCKDLVSLSEEETSFQSLTSLKLLSIRDCPKLVSLPDNGLPTSLESLSIGSCPSLESFGPKEMLKSLTILKDLYIEDCPALQSFPEEGLPHSLQHLHVEGCPSLTKHCEKDRGSDWSKIMHIPDLELESIKVSSVPNSLSKEEHPKIKTSSAFWKRRFTCCKGIDIIEIGGPQQLNRVISVQTERGLSSRGKMMPGEPSTSTEHGH
ncbi:hypothetical protein F0562_014580 [Nyssa sinensis]|uniref:Uncharacterized protein n=1 Tax=Nyssa sinensis TaxID=561372 RepID=A0A5J4ZR11_9ASTE|nr:hypothetical protein F0562_014580 [Nyssa sinensis]